MTSSVLKESKRFYHHQNSPSCPAVTPFIAISHYMTSSAFLHLFPFSPRQPYRVESSTLGCLHLQTCQHSQFPLGFTIFNPFSGVSVWDMCCQIRFPSHISTRLSLQSITRFKKCVGQVAKPGGLILI